MNKMQSKVCLVSFTAPYTIPYLSGYKRLIEEENIPCDIVFWDRDGDFREPSDAQIRYLPYSPRPVSGRLRTHLRYLPATRHIRRALAQGQYSHVIFLQTHAAVAAAPLLWKRGGKYLVDVRDFTLEHIAAYRFAQKRVFDRASGIILSSDRYRVFLPPADFTVTHNYTPLPATESFVPAIPAAGEPIRIAFIGNMRPVLLPAMRRLLDVLGGDERFCLIFAGGGCVGAFEQTVRARGYRNVELSDRFPAEETLSRFVGVHLINNAYGNANRYLDYALSNKLYHAAALRLPILVSPHTYTAQVAQQYGFGIPFDPSQQDAPQRLIEHVQALDRVKMSAGCAEFLNRVREQIDAFEHRIREFLRT